MPFRGDYETVEEVNAYGFARYMIKHYTERDSDN